MLFREDVVTRASPGRVWELISNPSLHGQWNPKIVATEMSSSGSPALGLRYRVTYELSGRRTELDAEIVEFSPPTRWVARLEERLKGDGSNFERRMVETYAVTPRGSRTHVGHDVRIDHSGVNIFLRALIWLIQHTGRPVGKTFMQRFGEIAESAGTRTPAPIS